MRLFIAVNFSSSTKDEFMLVQKKLSEHCVKASLSRRENLHLTLAFLGETSAEKLPLVHEAMRMTAVSPLELCFDRIGCFHQKDGELFWIGAQNNPALFLMQKELSQNLSTCGFSLENRRFVPHITLIRRAAISDFSFERSLLHPINVFADSISLMLSEQKHGSPVYTELYSVRGN